MRFTRGQRYLGGFCGGREDMEQWILTKLKEWTETIDNFRRLAVRYP